MRPLAEDTPERTFPLMAAAIDRVEPAPRRVRGFLGGEVVFDTLRALYVWESPYYPQYYVPRADLVDAHVVDEDHAQRLRLGPARRLGLRAADQERPGSARVYGEGARLGLEGYVRFDWSALDAWFEEDEEVFVHPRNPYVRVDALRSHRHVVVELDGVVLADTTSPVLLFETGLPTRHYIDPVDVRFEHLVSSDTESSCPYKGTTTRYWSVRTDGGLATDLAWSYHFPLPAVSAVAGLVAFYDEKVDVTIDGRATPRARSHFVDVEG